MDDKKPDWTFEYPDLAGSRRRRLDRRRFRGQRAGNPARMTNHDPKPLASSYRSHHGRKRNVAMPLSGGLLRGAASSVSHEIAYREI